MYTWKREHPTLPHSRLEVFGSDSSYWVLLTESIDDCYAVFGHADVCTIISFDQVEFAKHVHNLFIYIFVWPGGRIRCLKIKLADIIHRQKRRCSPVFSVLPIHYAHIPLDYVRFEICRHDVVNLVRGIVWEFPEQSRRNISRSRRRSTGWG